MESPKKLPEIPVEDARRRPLALGDEVVWLGWGGEFERIGRKNKKKYVRRRGTITSIGQTRYRTKGDGLSSRPLSRMIAIKELTTGKTVSVYQSNVLLVQEPPIDGSRPVE